MDLEDFNGSSKALHPGSLTILKKKFGLLKEILPFIVTIYLGYVQSHGWRTNLLTYCSANILLNKVSIDFKLVVSFKNASLLNKKLWLDFPKNALISNYS